MFKIYVRLWTLGLNKVSSPYFFLVVVLMNLTTKAIDKKTSLSEAKEIAEKLKRIYEKLADEHSTYLNVGVDQVGEETYYKKVFYENSIWSSLYMLHLLFFDLSLCRRRSIQLINKIKEEVEELEAEGIQIP